LARLQAGNRRGVELKEMSVSVPENAVIRCAGPRSGLVVMHSADHDGSPLGRDCKATDEATVTSPSPIMAH